jgi:hypothetical protein
VLFAGSFNYKTTEWIAWCLAWVVVVMGFVIYREFRYRYNVRVTKIDRKHYKEILNDDWYYNYKNVDRIAKQYHKSDKPYLR